ncbi:phosphatase PAP2 family protein [Tatumella punctata]|uniref:undecaprenyl-diphosphate phosphatase n=1 Tax=Tatumella punctata TaxID=399969 RepID=A0ABW1VLB2_9GAMM
MLKLLKLTASGMLILLVLPSALWVSGWHWQPGAGRGLLAVLFAATETVTRPWGILTTLILAAVLLWQLRPYQSGVKSPLLTLLWVVAVVWGGQGINALIKNQVREARPYVAWLYPSSPSEIAGFYRLSPEQRSRQVYSATAGDALLPGWLKQHWAFETGYSFPSGHSMFAACWALLNLVLLWPRRYYKTVIATFIWALLVIWSRMALGMHWPWDVIMSVVNAGGIVILVSVPAYLLLSASGRDME